MLSLLSLSLSSLSLFPSLSLHVLASFSGSHAPCTGQYGHQQPHILPAQQRQWKEPLLLVLACHFWRRLLLVLLGSQAHP